jgi:transcriptional regulator with XRE-family HTH domain
MNGDQLQLDLASSIRAVRRGVGMSQAELAARFGLAQSSVSQWEKGVTQSSTQHLLRLLQMFPASVPELVADRTVEETSTPRDGA